MTENLHQHISVLEALEKSERKYRELVDEAATIILRWDVNGNVTFFNEYAQKFFGFSEEEILGRNVVGTIVPETEFTGRDLAILMKEICLDPAKFEDNENENIKRNGETVWIAWKNRPIYNDAGELAEVYSVGIDITARKRAEDALRQSEARWRSITRYTPDHIMLLDREGNIQFINYTVPDLTPEQVIGNPLINFLPLSCRQDAADCLNRVWSTGEADQFTSKYQGADGVVQYYESNVGPVKEGAEVVSLIVSARNVTERINAAEAMRANEEKLRLLISQADLVLWSIDHNLKFTSNEGGGMQAFGMKPNDLADAGVDLFQLFQNNSRDYEPIAAHIQALQGKTATYETEWKGRYFQCHITPHMDADDDVTGCIGMGVDITERKQAEQRLRESEATARALLNVPSVLTLLLDREGCVFDSNEPMAARFGMRREEFIGKCLWDLLSPEVMEIRNHHILKSFNTGQAERWVDFRDGGWFESCATPVLDEQGNITKVALLAFDITERKRAEEELKRYHDHLEKLVDRRTAELEASNRELESYSYSIAHDLRSPLRTIAGFSQILKEDLQDRLSENESECLERVINAGIKLSQMIDEILELSRITRCDLVFETVDMTAIANDILCSLRESEPDRNVQCKVEKDMLVKGDSHLLEVVLLNLLENAWKYTSKKSEAMIEFGSNEVKGNRIYFVKDNGVGFDMKYQSRLFKPFSRLYTDRDFEGTGIGLATVQRILQRHGGQIWVTAEPDRGATFLFTLQENNSQH